MIQTFKEGGPNSVHTIVNGYLGETYLFINDNIYSEIDECSSRLRKWNFIYKNVLGIPPHIEDHIV